MVPEILIVLQIISSDLKCVESDRIFLEEYLSSNDDKYINSSEHVQQRPPRTDIQTLCGYLRRMKSSDAQSESEVTEELHVKYVKFL